VQKSKISKFTVFFKNAEEFHVLKREIFSQDIYFFESKSPEPVIIDAGAHIGLSTLYFKQLYPQAKIIALEPITENFALLEKNIWENNLSNAQSYQLALAPHTGELTLHADLENNWQSTTGVIPGNWTSSQNTRTISVPCAPLANFLNQKIDLLKIDIEGLEQAVLLSAVAQIKNVSQIICEFHPHPKQSLTQLVNFLEKNNFKVEIYKKNKPVNLAQATGLVLLKAKQQTKENAQPSSSLP